MAQHTSGPWQVNSLTRIEAADYGLIANVRGDLSEAETHANARLIAAAPELLDALESLEMFMRDCMTEDADLDVWKLARAAIAKAKGGAA
jgi:hypothetical protein